MVDIISRPGTQEKLAIFNADTQYDLACGTSKDETDGKQAYPVAL